MAGTSGAGSAGRGLEPVTGPVSPPEQRESSDDYAGTDRLTDDQKLLEGIDIIGGDEEANFIVLARETCFNLLRTRDIGRVAFTIEGDASPTVLPVNYAMLNDTIVFRSTLASTIMHHARGYAAFQVDRFDDDRREGWSVLASGQCRWVRDTDELSHIPQGHLPQPWTVGKRDQVLKITPDRVTGRQVDRT